MSEAKNTIALAVRGIMMFLKRRTESRASCRCRTSGSVGRAAVYNKEWGG
jgi:hypothetical protein